MDHTANPHRLTLRSLTATAVAVPMRRPLGTSARSIETASLLLLDLLTEQGVCGCAYAFCYLESIARALLPVVAELGQVLAGRELAPLEWSRDIARHFKLPGLAGPLAMVASSIDTAAWDALAVSAAMPLGRMLGAGATEIMPYNSNGLGLMSAARAADEAEELLERGFRGVKLRLGRGDLGRDLEAVRAVRKRLPDGVALMVDFNQALGFAEAVRACRALDQEGVYWIEEPIRHDDYAHQALLSRSTDTAIQLGENFAGLAPMRAALEADASDYVMPDLDRIGGVTGWLRAAGLAAAYDRPVSSHLFPEVSAHLLAATPGRHWLEYVDWAEPVLQEPLRIEHGMALLSERPGHGMLWDAEAVARFRLA